MTRVRMGKRWRQQRSELCPTLAERVKRRFTADPKILKQRRAGLK
jgi:hypothetical protein